RLALIAPVLAKPDPRVGRVHAIEGIAGIATGGQQSKIGILAKLALGSEDRRVAALRGQESTRRSAIVGRDRPQHPTSQLAGHPSAKLRVGDAAREEQVLRRLKESGMLEKEWPPLREE